MTARVRFASHLFAIPTLSVFFFGIAAFAKEKPRITIEVVNSESSQRHYTYTMPGKKGTSETNCDTNGTTNGTINDYGVGPIQTHSTGNASTNCTTTTTAATPPQTYVRSITQENVSAVLPDGRRVTLWCQEGFRKCDYLQPGEYEAEIDGNSLFVFVHDLSGREHRIKYKAVNVQEMDVASPPQPISTPAVSSPSQSSANTDSAPSTESIATLIEQAASGDAVAQYYLGKAYETGKGVSQDYTQDAIWFRKAAEQGLPDAQGELGGNYALGQGVPQDFAEAYFWLDLAAAGTPATVKPEDMTKARDYVTQVRDDVASLLTPEVRLRVQARVRQWLEDHPAKP
ncbi:MAG: tetratricopeptide repeat protein [Terracidiphilus sp.]|jgi:hypothetical protein